MADKSYVDQLKGLITEIIEPLRNEIKEQKEITKEQIAKALEDNKGLKEKLEKLESAPAQKLVLPTGGGKGINVYKGYNLDKQGIKVKHVFADESLKEEYAKFLIDVIKKAAMQEGTTTEGGYLVPDQYYDGILALARLNSFALTECDVIQMSTDTLRLPAENTTVTVNWAAEESANAESEPAITEVALTAVRMGAYAIASKEFLDDSAIDVVSWLTGLFAEAVGQELDNEVLNGTSAFDGIYETCTSNDVTLSGNSFADITATDLSEAISKMAVNKTSGAKFIMHRVPFHYIRALKDSQNQPIFANPGMGVPGTIYEYPYILSEKSLGTDSTASAFIAFGNLKNYVIGQRLGDTTLAVDPYGLFTTYQVRFRLATRYHGKPKFTSAFVRILTA